MAPDLVGFGRSDKPSDRSDYTYAGHVAWMRQLLLDDDGLDLAGLTLVGQDWAGLIGLRLVAEHPHRFDRVVVANTGLPNGRRSDEPSASRRHSCEAGGHRLAAGGPVTQRGID